MKQAAHYVYDAWGNIQVLQDTDGIATLNPFRYRSYYFDEETGLYYLQSRYYDPELGRFISADSIAYLDPETLGGLNLYAYCGNNPVMAADSDGTLPEWLKWLGIGLAVIGALLVVAAVTVLTAGVGTTVLAGTLAGAVIHGAAVGTLIGAGVGVVAGGLIGGATTGWSVEGILVGMGIGFGAGAIIGAIVGGFSGAATYTTPSGLKLKDINQAVNQVFKDSNKINHIMQPKHNLPGSIKAVKKLMKKTLIHGSISPYKSIQSAFWKVVGSEVTFKIIEGILRISDMWIRRK